MKTRSFILIAIMFISFGCDGEEETTPLVKKENKSNEDKPLATLPEIRKTRLMKGVNLSHWFAQQKNNDLTKEYINGRFSEADFNFIKDGGFTYVRLSVDERILLIEPNILNQEYLTELDGFIQKFLDLGVAVLFDFHPNNDFKDKVHTSSAYATGIKQFWGKLAKHLNKFDPNFLFLEVMNEPMAVNAEDWNLVQKDWVTEIRKNAPQHTIVVDGNLRITENDWDDVAALLSIEPFADKNIVYNFHTYQPFAFTHQGATWGWEVSQHTVGLKYPMDKDNATSLKNKHKDKIEVGWAMDDYIKQGWNKERIKTLLKPAADWANTNGLFVTVNEFGSYYTSNSNGKEAYIKDIREAMDELSIGWAVWDYDEGFGVAVSDDNGAIKFENGMKQALGL
ncbi:MAG: glycoside hydrolase family 5 protein [Cytophagales bacterium]|nr:glycoside hydrolase family 5 protein [Cytophagales bacterium]